MNEPAPSTTPKSSRRKALIALVVLIVAAAALSQWWASRQQAALGQRVAALAQPGDLKMLSSVTCPICTAARLWFKSHQVAFEECYIEKDRDCATLYEATRSPGTPVILVKGRPQVGFDPKRIADGLTPG